MGLITNFGTNALTTFSYAIFPVEFKYARCRTLKWGEKLQIWPFVRACPHFSSAFLYNTSKVLLQSCFCCKIICCATMIASHALLSLTLFFPLQQTTFKYIYSQGSAVHFNQAITEAKSQLCKYVCLLLFFFLFLESNTQIYIICEP